MTVHDECKLKFVELKVKRNYWFIIFKIEDQEVVVEKLGSPDETYEDYTESLAANECRYVVYDFDFITSKNCMKSKDFFSLQGNSTFPQISLCIVVNLLLYQKNWVHLMKISRKKEKNIQKLIKSRTKVIYIYIYIYMYFFFF